MHCSLTFYRNDTVFLVDTINTVSKNRHSLLIAIAVMDIWTSEIIKTHADKYLS